MSDSIATDEDWAIISSSSDFEDDATTASSVTGSADSEASSSDSDSNIHESTCTIRGENKDPNNKCTKDTKDNDGTTKIIRETESLVAHTPELPTISPDTTPATNTTAATKPDSSSKSDPDVPSSTACSILAILMCADQRVRAASTALFQALFAAPLRRLRKVAASGTLNIPLHQHAAYALLSLLERRQEMLIYCAVGAVATAASVASIASAVSAASVVSRIRPAQTSPTYADTLRLMWVVTVYEPQPRWTWFHQEKQLRVTRYANMASKQAYEFWTRSAVATSNMYDNLALAQQWARLYAGMESSAVLARTTAARWIASPCAVAVQDYGRGVTHTVRDFWSQHKDPILVSAKDTVAKASNTAFDIAHDVTGRMAALYKPARQATVNAYVEHVSLAIEQAGTDTWRYVVRGRELSNELLMQIMKVSKNFVDMVNEDERARASYERLEADTRIAAVHANRLLTRLANETAMYGQSAWSAVRGWCAAVQNSAKQ